jgi:hypothetical protein
MRMYVCMYVYVYIYEINGHPLLMKNQISFETFVYSNFRVRIPGFLTTSTALNSGLYTFMLKYVAF